MKPLLQNRYCGSWSNSYEKQSEKPQAATLACMSVKDFEVCNTLAREERTCDGTMEPEVSPSTFMTLCSGGVNIPPQVAVRIEDAGA